MKYIFPIKHIEDNLVFNQNGDCHAYYEVIPENYAFLSEDEKSSYYERVRQLIAQHLEGEIHILMLATESSVKSMQEKGLGRISKSPLYDYAVKEYQEQTDLLIGWGGENQVDYRFFIGFKLILNQEPVSFNRITKEIKELLQDISSHTKSNLYGDFYTVSNIEIERYSKVERLLENKISNRFKVKKTTPRDMGYILSHLAGQQGVAFSDFQYNFNPYKLKRETIVKKQDILKLDSSKDEKGRLIEIQREEGTIFETVMAISDITGEMIFPSNEILFLQQQQFDFPVDVSLKVEIIPNRLALATLRKKKAETKDLGEHASESGNEINEDILTAYEDIHALESELSSTKESLYKLSYLIRLTADSEEKLELRCQQVRDFYNDYQIIIARPFGDMLPALGEFVPGEKRYSNSYVQPVTSDFIAGLGIGTTQALGDDDGFYIGINEDTGKNVNILPSLVAQGESGTITNALAVAVLGSLGGGKSMFTNLVMYNIALYGGKTLIIDPKSERGNWKKDLPTEIAKETNIINLTSDESNKGLLDPFIIMDNPKDGADLARDIIMYLTGISIRDGEQIAALNEAVNQVALDDKPGLVKVIDELRHINTDISKAMASHIMSFMTFSFAHLLFSDGTVEKTISLNQQINILQVSDLIMPDKETAPKDYTAIEMLSVAMLMAISTFSLKFIKMDRSTYYAVLIDEAWALLNTPQGRDLSMKLVRAGRSMNSGVWFATQNADDLVGEKMRNNIGLKFAFRSTDLEEIKKILVFFGINPNDENCQQTIMSLQNGQCFFQDKRGRIGVVNIHIVFEYLFKVWDTRPPIDHSIIEETE